MARELTLNEARALLTDWAARNARIKAERNPIIKAAVQAELPKTEIAELAGINRQYLYELLPGIMAGPDADLDCWRPGEGGSRNPAGPGQ
jgi:hypothetical protein